MEQLRFILWYYALNEDGEFIYRRAVLQRLKGWGKDPLAAIMSWFELLGACRFSHWDPETGAPVGRRLGSEAHIQIIAVSLTQTQNTSRFLGAVLTDKAKDTFDVDLGKEVIYALGRQAQIQCVTSS